MGPGRTRSAGTWPRTCTPVNCGSAGHPPRMPGVDTDADLVVATASLEVGFNDPRVGLVLQHKAPHDTAGLHPAAGPRRPHARHPPVTVITLSDYGRDRLAYQGYETLFAPQLTAQRTAGQEPLRPEDPGRSVAPGLAGPRHPPRAPPGRSPDLLTAPGSGSGTHDDARAQLARRPPSGTPHQQDLPRTIWPATCRRPCRSAPTRRRPCCGSSRARCSWRWHRQRCGDCAATGGPCATTRARHRGAMLPEFVTRALFEPLNVPEVEFDLPFDTGRDDERLPIARALREAVPWPGQPQVRVQARRAPGLDPASRWRRPGPSNWTTRSCPVPCPWAVAPARPVPDGLEVLSALPHQAGGTAGGGRPAARRVSPRWGTADRPPGAGTAQRSRRPRSVSVAQPDHLSGLRQPRRQAIRSKSAA